MYIPKIPGCKKKTLTSCCPTLARSKTLQPQNLVKNRMRLLQTRPTAQKSNLDQMSLSPARESPPAMGGTTLQAETAGTTRMRRPEAASTPSTGSSRTSATLQSRANPAEYVRSGTVESTTDRCSFLCTVNLSCKLKARF